MTKREQIGERIRQRLQFLDKNQTWLADQFGVQQSTMSQYINGVRGLEAAELARLAQILDIEVAYFYGEADVHGRDVPPESVRCSVRCSSQNRSTEKGTLMLADIQRLSITERIQLAEDIWDTIALDPDAPPITDAQREELDRRLNALQQTPQEGVSWPELKVRLTSR